MSPVFLYYRRAGSAAHDAAPLQRRRRPCLPRSAPLRNAVPSRANLLALQAGGSARPRSHPRAAASSLAT
jgi:hypothetical protein